MSINNDFIKSKMATYKNNKVSDDDKLEKVASKAIKTTMIGALDIIEKEFGFLWNHGSNDDPTEEEIQMKVIYERVRAKILDNGNDQIRNLGNSLSKEYYNMQLPVIKKQ